MTPRAVSPLLCFWLMAFVAAARADCSHPALKHQQRDEATIRTLEKAWSLAYLTGDTEFEACLLAPDFTEIRSNGQIHHLSDELALAQKNKGKAVATPDMPAITVHLHGDAAVAYGISSTKMIDGKAHKSYFADYYIWKDGAWHAYFAQQTAFEVS